MQKIMFNTMAEFKREAINGRYIKGGYYFRGADYAKAMRKISKVKSNAIGLATKGGAMWFYYPKASEAKIENGTMTIFEHRVKFGNSDVPASDDCLKWDLERGLLKESDLTRYTKEVAKYELYKDDEEN